MTITSPAPPAPANLDALEAFMEFPAALALLEEGQAGVGAIVEFLAQDVVARHLLAVDRAFSPLLRKARA